MELMRKPVTRSPWILLDNPYETEAAREVESNPYCERCQRYLKKDTLWKISPIHAARAVAAFQVLDFDEITELPYCLFPFNKIQVELWSCGCRSLHFVELWGHTVAPGAAQQDSQPVPR